MQRLIAILCITCVLILSAADDDLPARIAAAPTLTVENVAEPVRATRGGQVEWVPNPDGKTWDVLVRYYNTYYGPHTTVIIDLGSGKVSTYLKPSALYSRSGMGPDGKYYSTITGEGGTVLQVYDPATNTVTEAGAIAKDVAGETRPIVIGTDGKMYGAGSSDARAIVYQFDPASGKIDNYGHVGPAQASGKCWGYSVGADDRFVYVASGKLPWSLVAYDRQTGKDSVLFTNDDPRGYVGVSQLRYGVSATSQDKRTGTTTRYWLYQGKAIEITDPKTPPWPEPAEKHQWVPNPPKPELGTGRLVPHADGKAELWYRQDKTADWQHVAFTVPTYPYPVHRVWTMPDGKIAGTGGNYLGIFIYDPATGQSVHPGVLSLSHYCNAVAGGKVYMSGYPSSVLFAYDPARPWTARTAPEPWDKPLPDTSPDANPRQLCYLAHEGSGCHKMLAAVVAGGKVFCGGRWYRNGQGGGLGWWDIDAAKAGGISEPFRNYQIHYLATAGDGRYVVASTHAVFDTIDKQPLPESARLFVFDTQTMKLVREIVPVKGALWTGPVAGAGGPFVLGLTYDPADRDVKDWKGKFSLDYGEHDKSAILYKVNVETGQLVWRKTLPYPAGFRMNENAMRMDGFDFRLGPDGAIWTFTGGKFTPSSPGKDWHFSYLGPDLALVRISPDDGAVSVVGKLDRAGEIAFAGHDVYLSGGCKYLENVNMNLRRIKGIVP